MYYGPLPEAMPPRQPRSCAIAPNNSAHFDRDPIETAAARLPDLTFTFVILPTSTPRREGAEAARSLGSHEGGRRRAEAALLAATESSAEGVDQDTQLGALIGNRHVTLRP